MTTLYVGDVQTKVWVYLSYFKRYERVQHAHLNDFPESMSLLNIIVREYRLTNDSQYLYSQQSSIFKILQITILQTNTLFKTVAQEKRPKLTCGTRNWTVREIPPSQEAISIIKPGQSQRRIQCLLLEIRFLFKLLTIQNNNIQPLK